MYYIFIQHDKINGAGQCPQITEGVHNFEVSEELYNSFVENPDKYIWDENNVIENPHYDEILKQKERAYLNTLYLTKREVFLALYRAKGLTPDDIKAQITDPEALIEFEYANEYYRSNPLIDLIGEKLGYTPDDIDYLFVNKQLPLQLELDVLEKDKTDLENQKG